MNKGTLYIISAPSGAGKSSLICALLESKLSHDTQISVSYTTRAPRPGEIHSKHYFFVNSDKFKKMITKNIFLEYAEIFGNYYGSSRKDIEQILITGRDVFLDIDWQGAQQIKKKMPHSRSIFILPPSKRILYQRLRQRGQDDEEMIAKRMKYATNEISHYTEYDYLIINDDFDSALKNLKTIIYAERLHTVRQKKIYSNLISNLLAD